MTTHAEEGLLVGAEGLPASLDAILAFGDLAYLRGQLLGRFCGAIPCFVVWLLHGNLHTTKAQRSGALCYCIRDESIDL